MNGKFMLSKNIKVVAMDLDGTITQHKQPPDERNKKALCMLSEKYKLLMVGAGQVTRIFNQLDNFPIDIIGNYGLQVGKYNKKDKNIEITKNLCFDVNKEKIESMADIIREKYGFTQYSGNSIEYHPSGCITFALLGTEAVSEDKLAFDPSRKKRRKIYREVCELFSDYNVFIGGSSSFDMAPKPYNKFYALDLYCKENNIMHDEVVYIGDDYGQGGNDESVYVSDFGYLTIDDYRDFPNIVKPLLEC